MKRAVLTSFFWGLCWLMYFSLVHVMDREGLTGTLFEAQPPILHRLAVYLLLSLRITTVLILPAMLIAFSIEAILARFLRKKRAPIEASMVETSQIGSSD